MLGLVSSRDSKHRCSWGPSPWLLCRDEWVIASHARRRPALPASHFCAKGRRNYRQTLELAGGRARDLVCERLRRVGPWHAFTRAAVQIWTTAAVIATSHFQAAVAKPVAVKDGQ
jgi:hypothetical protein